MELQEYKLVIVYVEYQQLVSCLKTRAMSLKLAIKTLT